MKSNRKIARFESWSARIGTDFACLNVFSSLVLIALLSFYSPLFALKLDHHEIKSKGFEIFNTRPYPGPVDSTGPSAFGHHTFSINGNRLFMGDAASLHNSLMKAGEHRDSLSFVLMMGGGIRSPVIVNSRVFVMAHDSYSSGLDSFIIGGNGHSIDFLNENSLIAGGSRHKMESEKLSFKKFNFISGGSRHIIKNAESSAIIGGGSNRIDGSRKNSFDSHLTSSVILGGHGNVAYASNQVVAGRYNNYHTQTLDNSFITGVYSKPDIDDIFVVGSGFNHDTPYRTGRANSFSVNKAGLMKIRRKGYTYEWSDRRLKKDIIPYQAGLKEILALNPVHYQWKRWGIKDIGLIAQEVYAILPDLVQKGDDEPADSWKEVKQRWYLTYEKINIVLINAVKERQIIIEKQESEIEQLQEIALSMKEEIEQLQEIALSMKERN